MKKNHDITKPRHTNFASPLALRYIEVPLYFVTMDKNVSLLGDL